MESSDRPHLQDWPDLKRLFLEITMLPASERSKAIAATCASRPELRKELQQMLAADQRQGMSLGAAEIRIVDPETPTGVSTDLLNHVLPESIGPYRVIRFVGEGSFAHVYEAEQAEPKRRVAVKLLRPGLVSTTARRRFRSEAAFLAKLDCPWIARVLDAGVMAAPDGRPYIVLEYVNGEQLLSSTCAELSTVHGKLEVLARICDAVQFMHSKGILHRDLKPDNILIDASGNPKLLDFGVAKLIDGDTSGTQWTCSGEWIGTVAYMSPEQASGDPFAVDTRTDVYSLGAIAYRLLSGRTVIDTSHAPPGEQLARVRAGSNTSLRAVLHSINGDIDAVVSRALALDRNARYGSAGELAADLRRAAAGEPVLARRAAFSRQVASLARRYPRHFGGSALV